MVILFELPCKDWCVAAVVLFLFVCISLKELGYKSEFYFNTVL